MTITWQGFVAAITPSLQALIFSALTALGMTAGITYLKPEKPAVAASVAPQTAPVRTPQQDQTKLQLKGIQDTVDEVRETLNEIRRDLRPTKAAAKAK